MKYFASTIFWAVFLTSMAPTASAELIYVDSSYVGAETSNGSFAAPFVLIQDALDVAIVNETILVRGGSGSWPLGYVEEGLIVDKVGITVTN